MVPRFGLLFLLILAFNWECDASDLPYPVLSGVGKADKRVDVCTLCEKYTSLALNYISENNMQTVVTDVLHDACSKLHSLEGQCIAVVDYYAPLLFSQLSLVDADDFCKKVNLCGNNKISSLLLEDDRCDLCHYAINQVILKLKDPDEKLEIIEILLKGCDAVENYLKKFDQCKAIVFEYGPLILANAEKFLESTDICTTLHVCSLSTPGTTSEDPSDGKILMVTSSS